MKWLTDIMGKRETMFVSIRDNDNGGRYLNFSQDVREKISLNKWVKLGYDEEKNMLVAIPSLNGVKVQKAGNYGKRSRIAVEKFFDYCGIDPELGRYPAKIMYDGEGGAEAWIDLNNRLLD